MLNVSPINSAPNVDNRYQNITILSRPPTAQSSSGQSNIKARIGIHSPKHVDTSLSHNCVESPSVVSPSVSLSSLPPPSDRTNGSQSLRSTVLANNTNTNSCNNKSNIWSNIGDKSPMCKINEISRFNDIKHEYHLIEELGPPHNKTFSGENEEFGGSGPSIKKAQRNAATLALQETKLKQPTPRIQRHNKDVWPMTPTVELNMLAMKLGQNAVYHVYEPPRHQAPAFSFGPIGVSGTATNAYDYRGMHYQRYHMPRGPFSASLTVGDRQFVGKGHTAQAARHAAAEEALKILRQLAQNCDDSAVSAADNLGTTESSPTDYLNGERSVKSPISLIHEIALKRNLTVSFEVIDESGPSHMPKFVTQCTVGHIVTTGEGTGKKISKKNAAILMVEELNKLEPLFVLDKSDTNKDSAGEQTTGSKKSGILMNQKRNLNKKKNNFNKNSSKDNIKRFSQSGDRNIENDTISNQINCVSNSVINVIKNRNVSNNSSIDNECQPLNEELTNNAIEVNEMSDGAPIHPINRLIQLQQARKEKDPHFTLVSERVIDRRRREFTIECTIHVTKGPNAPQTVSALGLGPNKKVAKKNAADQMLQLLGYSSRAQPHSILKQDSTEGQSQHKKIRQVKFIEDNSTASAASLVDMNCGNNHLPKLGRQLVPGLILMPSDMSANSCLKDGSNSELDCITNSKSNNMENISKKIQSISSIAKELVESKLAICRKKSENEDIISQCSPDFTSNRSEQLKSLAENVGAHQLQVHFSDFPRKQSNGQSMEYLSVVTITTVWSQTPIVSHGSGQTVDEARNQASHQALIELSQLDGTNTSHH